MAKRIFAFGMDGLITPMVRRFAAEGCLPNFQRMIEEGTVNETQPSFPVWTPTNWATLSTGAHTGTHGATRWRVQLPDGRRVDSFDGRALAAERIWNALDRVGMKSVAIHYPASHPSSGMEEGYAIDGFGHPGYASTDYEVAACQAYTTAEGAATVSMDHDGTAVRRAQKSVQPIDRLSPATGWVGLPEDESNAMATSLEVVARVGGDINRFEVLVRDSCGEGYDEVWVCRERDASTCIAKLGVGQWSEWAVEPFSFDGRSQRASVRFKLMELARDGISLKIYRSQVTFVDGFTVPSELSGMLVERFGPYMEHASMTPYTAGMADFDTALEECEYQGLWFAEVAKHVMKEKDGSFFICHWHLYDYLNHIHLADVDPVCPAYDAAKAETYVDYFRRAYQIGDRILGKLWEEADADTYVGILADHGCSPDVRIANICKFLHDSGFTAINGGEERLERDDIREEDIDFEKTTAYLKDDKGFDIFINANPGPEFDRIERELLVALRRWVDEESGTTPIAIALPKRDAYLLGQWGDQCGDVVFAWDHGYVSGYYGQWKGIVGGGSSGVPEVFGAHHGGFLPTRSDVSSSFGTLMLAGPGLKEGYTRPTVNLGYIHAVDVVPTFCHLLGVEPPLQSHGAIAYDLLKGREMVGERIS